MNATARLRSSLAIFTAMFRIMDGPKKLETGEAFIRRRMADRGERFLAAVARYIYGFPRSPYLPLLRQAGLDYDAVQQMVRQKGVEPTLASLRDGGVFLSYEEFKGRVPVARGGREFLFAEEDFDNPFAGPSIEARTGGTRSPGSRVRIGLASIPERAAHTHVLLAAYGGVAAPLVLWVPGFPSGAGLRFCLTLAHLGLAPAHWFVIYSANRPGTSQQRTLQRLARVAARLRGIRFPTPILAPYAAAPVVLDALVAIKRQHGRGILLSSPSAAVRLASLAQERRESLAGMDFLVGGEPLTAGKAAEIARTGARPGSLYAVSEMGMVGMPCADPQAPDDMHLVADCFALIQNRRLAAGVEGLDAYMFTTLEGVPRKVLLNVESDDFGDLVTRHCACPLGALGWDVHLSRVRSFTKLTGEGTTVLGSDSVRILEEVLPGRFGGRSIDYQLLEAEDARHLTRLLLLVSPRVGPVDESAVLAAFVQELKRTAPAGISPLWDQAETIRVVRREPITTAAGKLLPFHTQGLAPSPPFPHH